MKTLELSKREIQSLRTKLIHCFQKILKDFLPSFMKINNIMDNLNVLFDNGSISVLCRTHKNMNFIFLT